MDYCRLRQYDANWLGVKLCTHRVKWGFQAHWNAKWNKNEHIARVGFKIVKERNCWSCARTKKNQWNSAVVQNENEQHSIRDAREGTKFSQIQKVQNYGTHNIYYKWHQTIRETLYVPIGDIDILCHQLSFPMYQHMYFFWAMTGTSRSMRSMTSCKIYTNVFLNSYKENIICWRRTRQKRYLKLQ